MARTEPVRTTTPAAVGYRSPYASFMLTLIALLLAAILIVMIYGAVRARNASHTAENKIDTLTTEVHQIGTGLKGFTKP